MTDTAASPINLDTGDGIAASAARQKYASGGEQRQIAHRNEPIRPAVLDAQSDWSGKSHKAAVSFTVERPIGESRLKSTHANATSVDRGAETKL